MPQWTHNICQGAYKFQHCLRLSILLQHVFWRSLAFEIHLRFLATLFPSGEFYLASDNMSCIFELPSRVICWGEFSCFMRLFCNLIMNCITFAAGAMRPCVVSLSASAFLIRPTFYCSLWTCWGHLYPFEVILDVPGSHGTWSVYSLIPTWDYSHQPIKNHHGRVFLLLVRLLEHFSSYNCCRGSRNNSGIQALLPVNCGDIKVMPGENSWPSLCLGPQKMHLTALFLALMFWGRSSLGQSSNATADPICARIAQTISSSSAVFIQPTRINRLRPMTRIFITTICQAHRGLTVLLNLVQRQMSGKL